MGIQPAAPEPAQLLRAPESGTGLGGKAERAGRHGGSNPEGERKRKEQHWPSRWRQWASRLIHWNQLRDQ